MIDLTITLIILASALAGVAVGAVIAHRWYSDDGY